MQYSLLRSFAYFWERGFACQISLVFPLIVFTCRHRIIMHLQNKCKKDHLLSWLKMQQFCLPAFKVLTRVKNKRFAIYCIQIYNIFTSKLRTNANPFSLLTLVPRPHIFVGSQPAVNNFMWYYPFVKKNQQKKIKYYQTYRKINLHTQNISFRKGYTRVWKGALFNHVWCC